jgi:molybdopterin-binding protein
LRWPAEGPVVDIDEFVIASEERLVIFGPNGSGKTTALRLIAGIIGDRSGDGIAYLPQRPYLFRGTGRSNLHLGLDAHERELADRLAGDLGVAARLDGSSRTLSGGERMRIALARTLAMHVDLVLLDEPLAPLDLRDRERVAAIVAGAIDGRSSIIVSHDRDSAAILGDQLAVMIDGKIRQRGSINEVFTSPVDGAVADVVGVSNALDGVVVRSDGSIDEVKCGPHRVVAVGGHDLGTPVKVLFGGEAVAIHAERPDGSSVRNVFAGSVCEIRPVGRLLEIVVDCDRPIAAVITPGAFEALSLEQGSPVFLSVKASAVRAVAVGRERSHA